MMTFWLEGKLALSVRFSNSLIRVDYQKYLAKITFEENLRRILASPIYFSPFQIYCNIIIHPCQNYQKAKLPSFNKYCVIMVLLLIISKTVCFFKKADSQALSKLVHLNRQPSLELFETNDYQVAIKWNTKQQASLFYHIRVRVPPFTLFFGKQLTFSSLTRNCLAT